MIPEQDQFEELRRLLALKRHEQPPPGYFHHFSGQVIARIQAGETAASNSWLQRLLTHAPWLQGLWGGWEAKPIVAGAFGIGVCSLLVVGLVSSERVDSATVDLAPVQANLATLQGQNGSLFERAFADHSATGAVFTAGAQTSIFDEIRPHAQPVNFSLPAPAN